MGSGPAAGDGAERLLLLGLVGAGIQGSRTPALHEAEGSRLGLRCRYRLLDTDRMGDPPPALLEILRRAEADGFAGLNVTFPYKRSVMAHLDQLSNAARAVDAVNTVVFRDGRRIGHNTDMWGFAESFRQGLVGAMLGRVLLIGAGGAGGAVGRALLDAGVERLLIHDVDPARSAALAARLAARFDGPGHVDVVENVTRVERLDGVVNATPVGMASHPGTPFPPDRLSARMWVADIVYFPLETELLRVARNKGCRTLPGSGMAVLQAVRAFELFTGIAPDVSCMRATFDAQA